MSSDSTFTALRRKALSAAFRLLYGPLVLLHEPAGRLLFGEAWNARRLSALRSVSGNGLILDLGCGDGRLIRRGIEAGLRMVGVEPSKRMRARASEDIPILQGSAVNLPLHSDSVQAIVVTYPGRWIFEDRTWGEISRVLQAGGEVVVLLGGTYERGNYRRLRTLLGKIAYGRKAAPDTIRVDHADGLTIEVQTRADDWGDYELLTAKMVGADQSSE